MTGQQSIYRESELDLIPIGKITLLGPSIVDPSVEPFERLLTYHTTIGDIKANETPPQLKVHGLTLTSWAQAEQDLILEINVGFDNPRELLLLNANLPPTLATAAKDVQKSYKDVFATSYHDLKRIPVHYAKQEIKVEPDI